VRAAGEGARGAALVEFVVVLPVFLLIVFAAIDWGWYFVRRETVANAVREGARVGSVQPFQTSAAVTQAAGLVAAEAAIRNYLTGARFPAGTPACSAVAVGADTGIQCDLAAYPAGPLTGLGWTFVPPTISARAVMRFEVQ
jgi:Flp pilus assembly protein TadG